MKRPKPKLGHYLYGTQASASAFGVGPILILAALN
jgi:hypothetical protein